MVAEPRNPVIRPCAIVSVTALTLFLALSVAVRQENPLTELDAQIANSLHESQVASPAWTHFFDGVKELAGLAAIIGLVAVVGIVLVICRRYWLAIAWVVAVEVAALLNDRVLKQIVQRPRPPFGRPKSPDDWSFPSGHSLRGFVMYGLLAYLMATVLPQRWARILTVGLLALVVATIGFSRIYLGKHYFSDVCGSFIFGAAWVAGWMALIEMIGWRQRKQPAPAASSNEITPGPSPNPSTM
jgi:undecaprenyl-diphosphatase